MYLGEKVSCDRMAGTVEAFQRPHQFWAIPIWYCPRNCSRPAVTLASPVTYLIPASENCEQFNKSSPRAWNTVSISAGPEQHQLLPWDLFLNRWEKQGKKCFWKLKEHWNWVSFRKEGFAKYILQSATKIFLHCSICALLQVNSKYLGLLLSTVFSSLCVKTRPLAETRKDWREFM